MHAPFTSYLDLRAFGGVVQHVCVVYVGPRMYVDLRTNSVPARSGTIPGTRSFVFPDGAGTGLDPKGTELPEFRGKEKENAA